MEPAPLVKVKVLENYVAAKESEHKMTMKDYSNHSTKVTITVENKCPGLEDYPESMFDTYSFDATDLTIWAWGEQFRKILRGEGFAESNINELLGER